MKQKVLVTKFYNLEAQINKHLDEGWLVKFMCAENITGPSSSAGAICVIFEKKPSRSETIEIEIGPR